MLCVLQPKVFSVFIKSKLKRFKHVSTLEEAIDGERKILRQLEFGPCTCCVNLEIRYSFYLFRTILIRVIFFHYGLYESNANEINSMASAVRVEANLPEKFAICTIVYSKSLTPKYLTLKMKVNIVQSIRNGAIRLRISASVNVLIHFAIAFTVFVIVTFKMFNL